MPPPVAPALVHRCMQEHPTHMSNMKHKKSLLTGAFTEEWHIDAAVQLWTWEFQGGLRAQMGRGGGGLRELLKGSWGPGGVNKTL